MKEATQLYVFYCFIYIQNKWNFFKERNTQTVFWSFWAAVTFGLSLSWIFNFLLAFSTFSVAFILFIYFLIFFFFFCYRRLLEKFQKCFLVPLGLPRRLFTGSNLISSRWIWLEFKLIQYFMLVLVTCKFDDGPIKNKGAIISTFLPALKGR